MKKKKKWSGPRYTVGRMWTNKKTKNVGLIRFIIMNEHELKMHCVI